MAPSKAHAKAFSMLQRSHQRPAQPPRPALLPARGSMGWLACYALLACLLVPVQAIAQDYIEQVNARLRSIPTDKRADLVLLPALANMDAPPAVVASTEAGRPSAAMLLAPDMRGWDQAAQWAAAEPQQAALRALDTITKQAEYLQAMVFAQPYGIDGVPVDLVRAGLYTELGDPPTLATAEHRYLPRLTDLAILVHVEATRLADQGRPADGIDALVDLMHLGRMMADREFYEEVAWGYRTMIDSAVRIRDVAYIDYTQDTPQLTSEQLKGIIDRLDTSRKGFLLIDRLRLPTGDYLGALQILERIFDQRGRPTERFAPTMSALTTADRPLRRFGQAGMWRQLAAVHQNGLETRKALDGAYNDWAQLWTQNDFAPGHKLVRDYARLNPITQGVVLAILPDMSGLFNERRILKTEIAGTRTALGVLAYKARLRTLPVSLASLRPQILPEREIDPFGPIRDTRLRPLVSEFIYLVPRRDLPVDPTVGPQPLPIDVFMLNQQNFGVGVGMDPEEFVIYSTGPDGDDDTARRVRENTRALYDGDYLIWPPVLSLYREYLKAQGQLR
ncbi:MAG: hypothetical protein KatS3mg103_0282 [Phycisphaerales bacterium]|nr:MAG: hypothetical protein KatS3mg103_0282 [Phycisphaerales bacterium]